MKAEVIDFIGKRAGLLSLIELGLGSFLHALRIPFSGQFLSLNQGLILTRSSQELKKINGPRHSTATISNISALLKSFSPAGKKLTPMLAISMQGHLYSVGIFLFGHSLTGHLVGMTLLATWSFLQPFLIYMLIFGKNFIYMLEYFVEKLSQVLPVTRDEIVSVVVLIILVKILLGIGIVLAVHILQDEKLEKYENKMLDLARQRKRQKTTHEKASLGALIFKDMTHPLFLLSLMMTGVFLFFTKTNHVAVVVWGLRPLCLGLLFFFMMRVAPVERWTQKLERREGSFAKAFSQGLKRVRGYCLSGDKN